MDLVTERGGLSAKVELAKLSIGEQQLLVLARSILRNRASAWKCILILDEATSSIDNAMQVKIQGIVEKEFRENTVITVAHKLDLVRKCDTVIVLEDGRVAHCGAPSDVLQEEH
ncbi:P-loop containing nucleoside triphosphate hydrolase protein [Microthyrium microscopicum]|uniref:P-loop containing nucleoside triphosphate hydrolase protein n=1 Tax=Microthyrium microscopicum TaxID=703497 RepID=A0A6A6TW17_9PEZI|nr:P-loop containing nucleoside triphosphate hydrolase protein [Microthyrium microscopicum]